MMTLTQRVVHRAVRRLGVPQGSHSLDCLVKNSAHSTRSYSRTLVWSYLPMYDVTEYRWLCLVVDSLLLFTISLTSSNSHPTPIANVINMLTVKSFLQDLEIYLYPMLADNGGKYRNYLLSSLISFTSIW